MVAKSGIAVGLNKGHITTRRELKAKPSNKVVCIFGWMMDGFFIRTHRKKNINKIENVI
jgi:hypothetical protein